MEKSLKLPANFEKTTPSSDETSNHRLSKLTSKLSDASNYNLYLVKLPVHMDKSFLHKKHIVLDHITDIGSEAENDKMTVECQAIADYSKVETVSLLVRDPQDTDKMKVIDREFTGQLNFVKSIDVQEVSTNNTEDIMTSAISPTKTKSRKRRATVDQT